MEHRKQSHVWSFGAIMAARVNPNSAGEWIVVR